MAFATLMNRVDAAQRSDDGVWESTERQAKDLRSLHPLPANARVWRLDEAALDRLLGGVPGAGESPADNPGVVISLPMPDGSFERFRVRESPVMEPALAAEHPEIKSYRGQGVDNRLLTMRCNRSPRGFYAMITDGAELMVIQAVVEAGNREDDIRAPREYVSYYGRDYATFAARARCAVRESDVVTSLVEMRAALAAANLNLAGPVNYSVGDKLVTYKIAVATTTQFASSYPGGATPVFQWIDGVNVIFERELSISLEVVTGPGNNLLNSTAFSNGNADSMVDQARSFIKSRLAATNTYYDLGHVLGTGSGGKAYIGVVSDRSEDSTGPYRAGGATLVSGSVANPDAVVAMAHEIAHQFGAMHGFNATTGNCSGTRFGDAAVESGSGLTIMSLPGACGPDAIVASSPREARFHASSFEEILTYVNFINGLGGTVTATGNGIPTVNGGADYTIPKSTPFKLSATGSDPNGDPLTYSWEQMDPGASAYANPAYSDAGDPQNTTRPIFRPFPASIDPARTFPSLNYILNNANAPPAVVGGFQTAENLPSVTRALNFRVTVRDNRDFGGVNSDSVKIDVDGDKGPFQVTAPNTGVTWAAGSAQTVTWDVNGTNLAPIDCANVRIWLSTDGGNTFPTALSASTPNDGSQTITVPSGLNTTAARIKVEAVGNIFFDVSNVNFTITTAACSYSISPAQAHYATGGGSGTISVTAGSGCAWTAASGFSWITVTGGSSGSGNGTVSYSVASNTSATSRIGTVTIGGQIFTVTQAGTAPSPGLQYYPLPKPIRLFDSRAPIPGFAACEYLNAKFIGGQEYTRQARITCDGVTIPSNAQAIVGNATVTEPEGAGFITLWPNGQARPPVSNLNYVTGQTVPNAFTVGLGSDGQFRIFAWATTHFLVDVVGYYAPPATGGLYFHPLPRPIRLYDTRASDPEFQACSFLNAPITGNTELERTARIACNGVTIPSDATAITGSATATQSAGDSFITLWPNGQARPPVSNLNNLAGQTVSNSYTVGLDGAGKFRAYSWATSHLMMDITGYYSPSAVDVNGAGMLLTPLVKPMRLFDTRTPFPGYAACAYLNAPLIGGQVFPRQARVTCDIDGVIVTIPANAGAVIGNATAVTPVAAGYATLWPSGALRPPIANINFLGGQVVPSAFAMGLEGDGTLRVYPSVNTEFIVDLMGYFTP